MEKTASPSSPKWRLQVDHREQGSRLLRLLKESDAFELCMRPLKAGDYIINDRIVVERKGHADFARSIIDGRLFHQAASIYLPNRAKLFANPCQSDTDQSRRGAQLDSCSCCRDCQEWGRNWQGDCWAFLAP
jgi:hypothetical protein